MAKQSNKKQNGTRAASKSPKDPKKKVDMDELAQKIVALLLRELDIERERTGR